MAEGYITNSFMIAGANGIWIKDSRHDHLPAPSGTLQRLTRPLESTGKQGQWESVWIYCSKKSVCSIVEFLSKHRGCNITNHDHVQFAEYCRRIMTAIWPLIWHTCIWTMAYDDMSVFLLMDANGTVCVHMRSNGFIAVPLAAEDRVIYFSARIHCLSWIRQTHIEESKLNSWIAM